MSSTPMECDEGISMIDIFNILYKGSALELKPEEQRGTIKISSNDGVLYVYNLDKINESIPSLKYFDDILVTAKVPYCGSSSSIDMHLDLFNGAYKGYVRLDFESSDSAGICFDQLSIKSADSTGQILVRIGKFNDATAARLKVKVCLGDSVAASTYVHGVICATNSKMDFPHCTSVLFAKKEENRIQLQPDGEIPLSKSCVAVDMDSNLYVDISLNINGTDYKDTITFTARGTGYTLEFANLPPGDPKIEVSVSWNCEEEWIISNYDEVRKDMVNVG